MTNPSELKRLLDAATAAVDDEVAKIERCDFYGLDCTDLRTAISGVQSALPALISAAQKAEEENTRIGTHGDGCWKWGPRHYECAVRHAEAMEAALTPVVAIVDALEGVAGFPDEKPVDTRHMGDGKFNDWPGLTWGDLRKVRAALAGGE